MKRSELVYLHQSVLKNKAHIGSDEELRRAIMVGISKAGTRTLSWSRTPSYKDIVHKVAKRLRLPTPEDSDVIELERAILFKVIERSIDKLSADKKQKLAWRVEQDLRNRGIARKIAFHEIKDFVKLMGMDVGGTVGGVVLAAPGIAGMVGLNFLQWVVLKAVIITSGHIAAGGALLGLGAGGALIGIAGAVGPIGAGLALIYTAYVVSGPAFRYIIPAVCYIAAKRIELRAATISA